MFKNSLNTVTMNVTCYSSYYYLMSPPHYGKRHYDACHSELTDLTASVRTVLVSVSSDGNSVILKRSNRDARGKSLRSRMLE